MLPIVNLARRVNRRDALRALLALGAGVAGTSRAVLAQGQSKLPRIGCQSRSTWREHHRTVGHRADLSPKHAELIKTMVPGLASVAVLVNPGSSTPTISIYMEHAQAGTLVS
jgi:hypothetical protein